MTYNYPSQKVTSYGTYRGGTARVQACVNVRASKGQWCSTRATSASYDGNLAVNHGGWHTFRLY